MEGGGLEEGDWKELEETSDQGRRQRVPPPPRRGTMAPVGEKMRYVGEKLLYSQCYTVTNVCFNSVPLDGERPPPSRDMVCNRT